MSAHDAAYAGILSDGWDAALKGARAVYNQRFGVRFPLSEKTASERERNDDVGAKAAGFDRGDERG